jgi:hypothetical protein
MARAQVWAKNQAIGTVLRPRRLHSGSSCQFNSSVPAWSVRAHDGGCFASRVADDFHFSSVDSNATEVLLMRTVRLFSIAAGPRVATRLMPICVWFGIGLAPLLATSGCGDDSKTGGTQVQISPEIQAQDQDRQAGHQAYNKEMMKKGKQP